MDPDRSYSRDGSSRVQLLEGGLTHEIIGGFFETYNELGFGFRESIYKRALEITLRRRGLIVEREFPVEVFFQGIQIGFHRVDMLVNGRVIIEAKATHKAPVRRQAAVDELPGGDEPPGRAPPPF